MNKTFEQAKSLALAINDLGFLHTLNESKAEMKMVELAYKSLQQARNEALEEAAAYIRGKAESSYCVAWANAIRNLKNKES